MTIRFKLFRYAFLLASIALASLPFAVRAAPEVAHIKSSHYRGTWLEIGRRPMWLTDGCVAGYTTYRPGPRRDQIMVEDGCHEGTPAGKLKTIKGEGKLLDVDTTHAQLRVLYPFLITFNYWVLYEAPGHDWFISADPQMRNLWIYSRRVPTKPKLATMVQKAKSLGYDVRKLEFPAH